MRESVEQSRETRASQLSVPVVAPGLLADRENVRRLVEIGGRILLAVIVCVSHQVIFFNDVKHYRVVSWPVSVHHLPYVDFVWEFPPLTLAPVYAAHLFGNVWKPLFAVVFTLIMIGCEYGSLVALRRAFPSAAQRLTFVWTITVIPLATVTWFRLDFLSMLFATLGLVALLKGRSAAGWAAAGFASKLWPGVLVFGAALERRWKDAFVGAFLCGMVILAWWVWSPSGFTDFVEYRKGTGLQVESTLGALRAMGGARAVGAFGAVVFDPGRWTWVDPASFVVQGLVAAGIFLLSFRRRIDVVRALAAMVVLSMVAGRILSPQYVVWIAPFVVLLAAWGDRRVQWLYTAACWLTLLPLPVYRFAHTHPLPFGLMVTARNVVLWVLFAVLLHDAIGERRDAPERSLSSA